MIILQHTLGVPQWFCPSTNLHMAKSLPNCKRLRVWNENMDHKMKRKAQHLSRSKTDPADHDLFWRTLPDTWICLGMPRLLFHLAQQRPAILAARIVPTWQASVPDPGASISACQLTRSGWARDFLVMSCSVWGGLPILQYKLTMFNLRSNLQLTIYNHWPNLILWRNKAKKNNHAETTLLSL